MYEFEIVARFMVGREVVSAVCLFKADPTWQKLNPGDPDLPAMAWPLTFNSMRMIDASSGREFVYFPPLPEPDDGKEGKSKDEQVRQDRRPVEGGTGSKIRESHRNWWQRARSALGR
jgi:hypothetical protein